MKRKRQLDIDCCSTRYILNHNMMNRLQEDEFTGVLWMNILILLFTFYRFDRMSPLRKEIMKICERVKKCREEWCLRSFFKKCEEYFGSKWWKRSLWECCWGLWDESKWCTLERMKIKRGTERYSWILLIPSPKFIMSPLESSSFFSWASGGLVYLG